MNSINDDEIDEKTLDDALVNYSKTLKKSSNSVMIKRKTLKVVFRDIDEDIKDIFKEDDEIIRFASYQDNPNVNSI